MQIFSAFGKSCYLYRTTESSFAYLLAKYMGNTQMHLIEECRPDRIVSTK
jgi:hypothetical protein